MFGGMTHEFAEACTTSVTGASGTGKSTLLYILGLMLEPKSGFVELDGQNLSGQSSRARAHSRAHQFGFVFQDSSLNPTRPILDSVIEPALYAGWSRQQAIQRALELLKMTGVAHRASHRPGEISGGQAQRVALARALVNDPAVILADEPTGNLDRLNAAAVLDILHEQARFGRTVIVVTHDPFVVERSDRQVVLT